MNIEKAKEKLDNYIDNLTFEQIKDKVKKHGYELEEIKTKVCTGCGEYKNFEEFHKDKSRKYCLSLYCSQCVKIKSEKYENKNRNKVIEAKRKYNRSNREVIQRKAKLYKDNNSKRISTYRKKYRKNNREKLKSDWQKYKEENREKIRENKVRYNFSRKLDISREEIPEMLVEARIHLIDAKKKIKSAS